jgi:hypothetical protein
MNPSFITSPDGTRIAYDVTGEGSPLFLLHGGGYTRQNWHDVGYVKRLKDDFKVIAIDIRGNGESDKPTAPACYTTDKMGQDILAVADASWGEDDFRDLVPDDGLRRKLVTEINPRPLSFFTEPIPVFEGWPDVPCAYIKFSAPYERVAQQAQQAGWFVHQVEAGHFSYAGQSTGGY